MKKVTYLWMIAATLLVGCAADDELAGSLNDEGEVTVKALRGDVPIEFGQVDAEAYVTRGAITEANFGDTGDLGVFCVAKKAVLTGASEGRTFTLTKQSANATINLLSIWQDNVKAKINQTSSGHGNLQWKDTDDTHFYPNKEWFAYDFFAYHPYTDSVVYASSYIMPTIEVDGDDDVFYATAAAPTTGTYKDLAYCSSYFKETANAGETAQLPYFSFQHVMAKLNFTVRLKDTNSSATLLYVDSIAIENFPNVVWVRYLKSGVTASSFVPYDPYSSGNFWLREADGSSISGKMDGVDYAYRLSTTKTTVGDCILIPPVVKSHSRSNPKLRIYLKDDAGSVYTTNDPIAITAPAAGWESAKQYNINISLSSPVKIQSNARIVSWDSSVEEIDVED